MSDAVLGKLYLCATPIGNLGDITLRALETLKEVDLIAAEDTRRTRKLLSYYAIHTALTSYHRHNRQRQGENLLQKLLAGQNVALVSDAGTPGLSDPGLELVQLALEHGVSVVPLPGASALLPALTVSGLPMERFVFEGFLPRQNKERQLALLRLAGESATMVFYEAPHRLQKTLTDLSAVLGTNRRACVARELTKRFEEIRRGSLEDIKQYYGDHVPRGEFVLVVEGAAYAAPPQDEATAALTPEQHVAQLVEQGLLPNEAIKKVARQRNIPRRDLYDKINKNKL